MDKDYKQVWSNCLRLIKDNVRSAEYSTWFADIVPVKLNGRILTIQVPSTFYYEYLEETYIDLLRKVLHAELGDGAGLEYNVVLQDNMMRHSQPLIAHYPSSNKKDIYNNPVNMPNEDHSSIKNPFIIPGLQKLQIDPKLNNRNTFSRLVEGEFNRLARSAGYAIATNPGKTTFNPLFIYGASGLGKTHLAQAIGIETKDRFQDKTVLYVTGHEFSTQFVDSTMNNTRNDFLHFYQMIDLLIIDDIHELSGKEKTQDIFFEIFNHLHQTGKQLIITSDTAPADLQGIEPRLLSRFKWGLSAELTNPDYDSRKAILKQYAYNEGIEISDDILEYVAAHITNNIRELEGALISLLAHSTLNRETITIDLARQIIDKLVKNTTHELNVGYIQKVVCDYFNLNTDAITSKTRKREIVQARQIAMYFAKNMTKLSLATIGSQIGGKDHATVLHACKTVNNLIDTDRQFKGYIDEIEKKLKM
ncbi:MAG: chromosomal replication initiator protein DnaA [Salinivirgaceae bacterium]|nr:chromosomal replication initiator protein DnaA [Salinivirgaceae bacterium]